MAFTVETGAGVANANAYISIADADAYHADRVNAGWTGTSAAKQAAILKATDYVEARWGRRYRGYKLTEEQGLGWPRECAVDDDGYDFAEDAVPSKLKQAVAEYALRALTAELAPDPTQATTLVGETKTVGPITTSKQYVASGAVQLLKPYPKADMLIRAVTVTGGRVIRG